MIRIAKLQSNTNGNSHSVRNVLCIIMSFQMAVVEILLLWRFASEREKDYKYRCCDIYKEKLEVKLITYK
jgi:hypothetical protein